jgi:hypothetical protein
MSPTNSLVAWSFSIFILLYQKCTLFANKGNQLHLISSCCLENQPWQPKQPTKSSCFGFLLPGPLVPTKPSSCSLTN